MSRRSMYIGNGPCNSGTGLRRLHTTTSLPNVGAYTFLGWCFLFTDRSQAGTFPSFQIMGGLDTALDTSWCQIGINNSGQSVCTTVSGETAFSSNFPIGSWFPFAIVGDGDSSGHAIAYFLPPGDPGDGSTMLSATVTTAPTTAGAPTTDFSIGGASNVDTEWMDAAYSDCMMWSVPLTLAQVKAQFIATSSAPIITSNLYGNWKCDNRSNFGLDSSAGSHNLTVLGNPIYGPLITFSDDSGSPPAAQGIIYRATGTEAVSAASGSTVAPTYPSPIVAGEGLLLAVWQKPTTANGGGVTTPSGFSLIDSLTGANDGNTGGYTTTLGADTGNVNLFVYKKDNVDGTESGTLTINLTNNNVAAADFYRVSNGGGSWSYAGVHGKKTAAGGSVSIAMSSDPGAQADDHYFAFFATPTDINSPGQKYSAHAFSQSGITFAGVAEGEEIFESNGNDLGGYMAQGPIASGTSSGVPTVSSTGSGTTTNIRGPMVLIRLRELSASLATYIDDPPRVRPPRIQLPPKQILMSDPYVLRALGTLQASEFEMSTARRAAELPRRPIVVDLTLGATAAAPPPATLAGDSTFRSAAGRRAPPPDPWTAPGLGVLSPSGWEVSAPTDLQPPPRRPPPPEALPPPPPLPALPNAGTAAASLQPRSLPSEAWFFSPPASAQPGALDTPRPPAPAASARPPAVELWSAVPLAALGASGWETSGPAESSPPRTWTRVPGSEPWAAPPLAQLGGAPDVSAPDLSPPAPRRPPAVEAWVPPPPLPALADTSPPALRAPRSPRVDEPWFIQPPASAPVTAVLDAPPAPPSRRPAPRFDPPWSAPPLLVATGPWFEQSPVRSQQQRGLAQFEGPWLQSALPPPNTPQGWNIYPPRSGAQTRPIQDLAGWILPPFVAVAPMGWETQSIARRASGPSAAAVVSPVVLASATFAPIWSQGSSARLQPAMRALLAEASPLPALVLAPPILALGDPPLIKRPPAAARAQLDDAGALHLIALPSAIDDRFIARPPPRPRQIVEPWTPPPLVTFVAGGMPDPTPAPPRPPPRQVLQEPWIFAPLGPPLAPWYEESLTRSQQSRGRLFDRWFMGPLIVLHPVPRSRVGAGPTRGAPKFRGPTTAGR